MPWKVMLRAERWVQTYASLSFAANTPYFIAVPTKQLVWPYLERHLSDDHYPRREDSLTLSQDAGSRRPRTPFCLQFRPPKPSELPHSIRRPPFLCQYTLGGRCLRHQHDRGPCKAGHL